MQIQPAVIVALNTGTQAKDPSMFRGASDDQHILKPVKRSFLPCVPVISKHVFFFVSLKGKVKNCSGHRGISFTTNHGFAPFFRTTASCHQIFFRKCALSQLKQFHILGLWRLISICFYLFSGPFSIQSRFLWFVVKWWGRAALLPNACQAWAGYSNGGHFHHHSNKHVNPESGLSSGCSDLGSSGTTQIRHFAAERPKSSYPSPLPGMEALEVTGTGHFFLAAQELDLSVCYSHLRRVTRLCVWCKQTTFWELIVRERKVSTIENDVPFTCKFLSLTFAMTSLSPSN